MTSLALRARVTRPAGRPARPGRAAARPGRAAARSAVLTCLMFLGPGVCLAETVAVAATTRTDLTGLTAFVGVVLTGAAGTLAAYAKVTENRRFNAVILEQNAVLKAQVGENAEQIELLRAQNTRQQIAMDALAHRNSSLRKRQDAGDAQGAERKRDIDRQEHEMHVMRDRVHKIAEAPQVAANLAMLRELNEAPHEVIVVNTPANPVIAAIAPGNETAPPAAP
jgi:hypothetical protein